MVLSRTQKQILVFILLLTADQLSKWWIEQQDPFFNLVLLEGFVNFIKAHNYGVAFSMFADWGHAWRTNILLGVTMGIAIAVFVWWLRERKNPGLESWLLMLVLVGAAGNIWDRLTLGYVVDFIDCYVLWDDQAYHWPAFNVADACISVAVVFLLVSSFKKTS